MHLTKESNHRLRQMALQSKGSIHDEEHAFLHARQLHQLGISVTGKSPIPAFRVVCRLSGSNGVLELLPGGR